MTGIAFLLSLVQFAYPQAEGSWYGLYLSSESYLLTSVICFISLMVQAYARRHLSGARLQRLTFRYLVILTASLILFSSADHLGLMVLGLAASNFILGRLIAYHQGWEAARASGRMAWQSLGLGVLLLSIASVMVYVGQGSLSLQSLGHTWEDKQLMSLVAGMVIVAAMAQSALFPLHGWLIASANAPTPISAFMHAGLVNGGALLLYKFYPLLVQLEWTLTVIFFAGALTALLGTAWMLVQSDVKRTLTCSTVGQMGFMVMQCGLGLFPAAIAHMIWHGLFKGSLFLSAGSAVGAARNQSLQLQGGRGVGILLWGLLIGSGGTFLFWLFTGHAYDLNSTYLLLLCFAGMTCAHFAMNVLNPRVSAGRMVLSAGFGLLFATVYGGSVLLVERQLELLPALPLAAWHFVVLAIFVLGWLGMLFRPHFQGARVERYLAALYVQLLNSSQPHTLTTTARRSTYRG